MRLNVHVLILFSVSFCIIQITRAVKNINEDHKVYDDHNIRGVLRQLKENIEIQHYEDPTELADIDNFDYKNRAAAVSDEGGGEIGFTNEGRLPSPSEYETNYDEDKIVGGYEVDINMYPYHVQHGYECAGAIIDKRWVLTAGHCSEEPPYVKVGSKRINQGKRYEVAKTHLHPQWWTKNKDHPFDYDFQLLELAEDLRFDDNVQPVKVARASDMKVGTYMTVTGWGSTEEYGQYSNSLRAVQLPIISKDKCQHVPYPFFRGSLTPRMFCAGFSDRKEDACQGDSGGPAVASDRLLGMVSFGYGCATPGSYGVYSNVAVVRPWIEQVTGLNLV